MLKRTEPAHKSRQHSSDEFGRTGLGPAAAIGDRALGAASGVIVDGLVEAESGKTPGPGLPSRTIIVGFTGLVLVAVTIVAIFAALSAPDTLPAGLHPGVWLGAASSSPAETDIEFELMPDVGEDEQTPVWAAHASDQAVILIDGRTADVGELNDYLQPGMVRADVTATDAGVISRIEIVTPQVTHE